MSMAPKLKSYRNPGTTGEWIQEDDSQVKISPDNSGGLAAVRKQKLQEIRERTSKRPRVITGLSSRVGPAFQATMPPWPPPSPTPTTPATLTSETGRKTKTAAEADMVAAEAREHGYVDENHAYV